jgi:hypothetical protein
LLAGFIKDHTGGERSSLAGMLQVLPIKQARKVKKLQIPKLMKGSHLDESFPA